MSGMFDELTIGTMTMPNRIVRAATAESLGTREGAPSERLATLYAELAEGAIGLIITGYAYVAVDGKPAERSLGISDDSFSDEYRALTRTVHDAGGRVALQLVYGGSKSKLAPHDPRFLADCPESQGQGSTAGAHASIVGPSAVENPSTGIVPREATELDLTRIRKAFADAAARAKRYGFDGVEVHAAHGYLLSQFLDGRFNKRTDEYGGSLENRARLAVECVAAVRAQVGEGFPVLVKLNNCDVHDDPMGRDGGMSEEESLHVAQMLVQAGASCIEVSGDWHACALDEADGEPFFGAFGARLAAKVDVPVIVTGGWRDPEVVERYLQATGIAAVGMARPLINEPFLLHRWEEGDSRPAFCLSCNFCTKQPGIPCINRR